MVEAVNSNSEPVIDFETVEREISREQIYFMRSRSHQYFLLSESFSKEWMAQEMRNAAHYRHWKNAAFAGFKIFLDVAQIGLIAGSGGKMKEIKPWLQGINKVQGITEVAKQFFETLDNGIRSEGQAKASLSKLLFERNEREEQASEQQKQEYHRKNEESRRRREDIEQAMAR